jgi:RNA polymerase primary sigma factor
MEDEMKSIKSGDYTLEEIAKILGITRERVRQIETQALKKLKSPNIGRKLKDYVSGEL